MRARVAGIASFFLAGALLHCSVVVDTDGLSGGAAGSGSSSTEAGALTEGGVATADGSTDGPATPGAFGTVWLAYGTGAGKIAVRTWDEGASKWSAELPGPSVGGAAVRWVVPKETPIGSFLAVVSQGASAAKLDVFRRAPDGTWALGFSQPMPVANRRAFDIEYETKANGIVVAYGDGTSHPKARRFAAGVWSEEDDIGKGGTYPPQWIELARNPLSDEITIVWVDDGINLFTNRWNGKGWLGVQYLEELINTLDWKCFDAAYENATGDLVIAWGRWNPDNPDDAWVRFRTRSFDAEKLGPVVETSQGTPLGSMVMVPEVGSSRILVPYVEYNCNRGKDACDDFGVLIWDGSSFEGEPIDPETTTLFGDREGSVLTGAAWIGVNGHAVAAYHRDLKDPTLLAYSYYGTKWSPPRPSTAVSMGPRASMQLSSVPGSKAVAVVEDTTGKLWSQVATETATGVDWADATVGAPLESGLIVANGVAFAIASP